MTLLVKSLKKIAMKQIKLNLWYIQVVLLLVVLQNALGILETPYFLERKKMLEKMEITLHPRPKDSKVNKLYYVSHPIRRHNYNLTINEPDLCSKHNQVFLLILYRTFYGHVKWRAIIRELVKHQSPMPHRKGLLVKYLFIFGNSGDPHMENLIRNESKHYRDIIQEDFHESYFNLTKKVITAWKWTVNYCPNAEYVMILNDELLLDLDKIISFLLQDYSMGQNDDHFALCYSRVNIKPMFREFARYQAMPPESLYIGGYFPPYCHGWGYVAHVKVINKLYKASFTNPTFMPTDAWIGILSEKLRLKIIDHRDRFVLYEVANYFADSQYPIRQGMIAVTDLETKDHELKVMESIIKRMDIMPYILQRKKMLEDMKVNLHPQPKNSKVDKYYYSHNLTSNHNYSIMINEPNLCIQDRTIFLLILIRTHYAHMHWREIIREMLNHKHSKPHRKNIIVKHLFIFANSNDPHIENLVRNESKYHRDIIQEDFPETYLNLIKKVVTAWKWTVTFCPNADYVMITNDEVLIDVEKVIDYLIQDYAKTKYNDHFAICYPVGNAPVDFLIHSQFKNMSYNNLYKGEFYPPYCHGWAYVVHINVVNRLYKASLTNPPFMPTDVWIGVLAEKLRVKVTHKQKYYILANIDRYFENPLYPLRPGMIAVTDEKANKHHEYAVMKSVIKSMRRHWNVIENVTTHLKSDARRSSAVLNDFSNYYIAVFILNFTVISILVMSTINLLLKRYNRKPLVHKRKP